MVEQVKRLVVYTQNSYFQHLRLYDFVLKNTKLNLKKYVTIPQFQPQMGDSLNKAMAIEDNITMS
jgi:Flagellar C1a complex subunit C1a-32